ncbi:hypothetical protein NEAUS06_0222 [Nematocida ausubeli]|nr:hypothetical protein NEAUS06_0222 [Nematocida ausubeli]
MASESTKRRIKRNSQQLKILIGSALVLSICAVLGNGIFRKSLVSGPLVVTVLFESLVLGILAYLVHPKYIKTSKGLEIMESGIDLQSRGIVRVIIDILYTFYGIKVSSVFFGCKAFILMLIIPVTAYYELFRRINVKTKTQ